MKRSRFRGQELVDLANESIVDGMPARLVRAIRLARIEVARAKEIVFFATQTKKGETPPPRDSPPSPPPREN